MDILNFISWIKAKRLTATPPDGSLIAVGAPSTKRDDKYLTVRTDAWIGNYSKFIWVADSFMIDDYNPKLFLALAAMTDKEDGNIGEYWKFIGDDVYCGDSFDINKLYKQRTPTINLIGAFIDNQDGYNGFHSSGGDNLKCFVKATQEEIIKEFGNNEIKEIKMKNRILTPENATKIINIACSTWKPKLAEKWATNIVLGLDTEISEEFYVEMRGACTITQNELFDTIFGKDEQLISTSDLEIGEAMIVVEPNGRWDKVIIARIWNEEGKDATYVNMKDPTYTWTPIWILKFQNPKFKGKRVKLTVTHEEVK
jgi:hypothetical protein